jgi:hypothetical protein
MGEKALVPTEQKDITFYQDTLTAVSLEDGTVYVPLRPICDYLGLNWSGQRQRTQRDPILGEVSSECVIHSQGQGRAMLCLPLEYLQGWLFGVTAKRVKDEVRENLLVYQRECYRVLADAFLLPNRAMTSSTATLLQVREMGLAIARMAEEQIDFDQRLTTAESKLVLVANLDERLQTVEQLIAPGKSVTQSQAMQISQAVKTVALSMPEPNFGAVYGQLYREYEITSYKNLPANKFKDAMNFLTEWFIRLTGDENVPF